jgi:hypothetical protein
MPDNAPEPQEEGEKQPARCKARVFDRSWPVARQCPRKAKRDGYCGQHHPDAEKAREEKGTARYEAKQARKDTLALLSPVAKAALAHAREEGRAEGYAAGQRDERARAAGIEPEK